MKGLIKKVSILVLSVLVLVGGSLGGVSSVYAKSFYQLPDPYIMDKGYQNLLKYRVLGYKEKFSDALGVLEQHADSYSPRRHSFRDSFEHGYAFIEFLIKYYRHLENGIYIFKIYNYYYGGYYYYVIQIGNPLGKVSSISSNSSKKLLPDLYLMDKDYQKLYRYKVVGYKGDLDDAIRDVEGVANEGFPKISFEKKPDYPEKHFFKNGENKEDQYKYGFKNGYEFISFLEGYRKDFKKGHYILEVGSYYNGGYYYYIIKFY